MRPAWLRAARFRAIVAARTLAGERAWRLLIEHSPLKRHRLIRLTRDHCGGGVAAGPFEGMTFLEDAVSGAFIPKLLGVYERELHGILTGLAGVPFTRIVNVGGAEGYYAVGLARLFPRAEVLAFEAGARGRDAIRRLAAINGVAGRAKVEGWCDPAALRTALEGPGSTLVWCDVEGYEDVLLDPQRVPALRETWVVVELHDGKNPGVSERVREAFGNSHEIEVVWQQERSARDFWIADRLPGSFSPDLLGSMIDEGRPVRSEAERMCWYFMRPRALGQAA